MSGTLPSPALPVASADRQPARLPLVYGVAHGGKTLFWTASDLYFAFYMNEVCGIAPRVTGLIVGGSILVAALADLTTGRSFAAGISDARQAGRLQLAGGVASGAALLLFAATAFTAPEWRVVACVATLLLFRIAYAVIDLPQNALLSLAPRGPVERGALVAARNVAGGAARIALATAFVPIMDVQPPVEAAPRFLWLVAVMAVLVIAGATLLAHNVAATDSAPHARPAPDAARGTRRHYLRMAIASAILTAVVQLEPYLATRGIADRHAGMALMIAIAAGAILAQPLWLRLALSAPQRQWPAAFGAIACAAAAFLLLPLQSPIGSTVAGLIYGLASGGLSFTLWSGFAQAVRGPAAFAAYARFTAAAKLGQGCAIVASGVLLGSLQTLPDPAWHRMAPHWMAAVLIVGLLLLACLRRVDSSPNR